MRTKLLSFVMVAGMVALCVACIPPKSPPKTTTTTAAPTTSTTAVIPIDWTTTPQALGQHEDPIGTSHTFHCPANGTASNVWGTARYTADSSICTAAVHDGRITLSDGGDVTYVMLAGQDAYLGSTANGITSLDWDFWGSTFQFS